MARRGSWRGWFVVVTVVVVMGLVGTGCGGGDDGADAPGEAARAEVDDAGTADEEEGRGDDLDEVDVEGDQAAIDESAPTTETVQLRDPVEDAFWVEVPKGWDSVAYSNREYDVHREVVNAVSPDGGTVIFLGDPKIPQYWSPDVDEFTRQFLSVQGMTELRRYTPAETYFPEYAQQKYGHLPAFAITSVEPNQQLLESLQRQVVQAGLPSPTAQVVDVFFSYEAAGKPVSGLLVGSTIDVGSFWVADVSGLVTDRKVDDYRPMLGAMSSSRKTNPEWTRQQQANHEAVMAQIQQRTQQMTQQHNANMAWIQDSAQRHQTRMQAIWSANDASIQSYNQRMASSDNIHRGFINSINGEHTVTNSSGKQFQVDNSYQTYFMNKNDNTYVGGDIRFNDDSIRQLGLNPDDYEQVQIAR